MPFKVEEITNTIAEHWYFVIDENDRSHWSGPHRRRDVAQEQANRLNVESSILTKSHT